MAVAPAKQKLNTLFFLDFADIRLVLTDRFYWLMIDFNEQISGTDTGFDCRTIRLYLGYDEPLNAFRVSKFSGNGSVHLLELKSKGIISICD